MADDAAARAFLTGLGGALVATAMPTTTVEETLDALADRCGPGFRRPAGRSRVVTG
ncbi:hypothetical protein [Gordonia sp. PP30]|uniref:hypothetical protein n=1 Tax=unclassified Gordonia (in: high G+C Gram-positive bacteria) TaxID=2657482 RepID=UPI001FFFC417|nr:hypothetical protein [Gordonia sp. PP30]UQE74289.1 hypothetical protein MYK68_16400 [Gordonia sp. PP30]